MIVVDNLVKQYPTREGSVTVLDHINLRVQPGERVGILGRNGSGKSTLIRMLGGAEPPTSGSVTRTMKVSWPLAFSGGFQGSLTGLDNLRFICRVYGVGVEDRAAYVQDFAELGRYFYEPIKTYSSGMRARLAFAISMAVEFDCFLVDEVIAVGDDRFREKCQHELFEKRADRAMLMVSHNASDIQRYCHRACVLERGVLHSFNNVEDAYTFYHHQEN